MEPKRLRKIILETMALKNLTGYSIEAIALRIEKELKNPAIKRKRIEKEIETLINTGQLNRTKVAGKNSHVITFSANTKEGTLFVVGKNEGGYIIPFGTNKRIPIPIDVCRDYSNGDTVSFLTNKLGEISISKRIPNNGKTNVGLPVSNSKVITGYVFKNENGHYEFFAQDKKRFPNTFVVTNNLKSFGALEGCIVAAELTTFGTDGIVAVKDVIGRIGDPLPETNALAMSAGINLQPNPKIEEELKYIPTQVDASNYNYTDINGKCLNGKFDPKKPDYVDLRDKMFTTIDPFDCRDMDDSVYTELDEDGNFVTYSAIADVTEFIKPGSELWNSALRQGFTLYTPYDAYAMLPKVLSHGILSLNPGEDRLTLCAKTVIDKQTGKRIPEKTQIIHAVINSKNKFSYNEVQNIMDSNNLESIVAQLQTKVKNGEILEPSNLLECVALNKVCSDKIWEGFNNRDILSINRNDEKQFVLSEDGTKVLDITPKEHLKSMSLIEALMINTNEAIAEYTRDNKLNSIYRVHDQPNMEKVERLKEMMRVLEIDFNGNGGNSNLQKLINSVKGQPLEDTVKEFVLRTQSKAKYSNKPYPTDVFGNDKTECACHSALSSECYTHFTSGIRRMSDLIVQYEIKEHLRHHKQPFSEEYVAQVATLVSSLEITIEDAERKINDLYVAIWAEDHINDVMTGKIAAYNGNNVILENEEKGIRVFVPLQEICENGHLDDMGIGIYNEKGEIVKKLCDKVDFKISGADRVGRIVYGSTDLTKTYKNEYSPEAVLKEQVERLYDNAGEKLVAGWKAYNANKNKTKETAQPLDESTQTKETENQKLPDLELKR